LGILKQCFFGGGQGAGQAGAQTTGAQAGAQAARFLWQAEASPAIINTPKLTVKAEIHRCRRIEALQFGEDPKGARFTADFADQRFWRIWESLRMP
jgi:hypothetical protein